MAAPFLRWSARCPAGLRICADILCTNSSIIFTLCRQLGEGHFSAIAATLRNRGDRVCRVKLYLIYTYCGEKRHEIVRSATFTCVRGRSAISGEIWRDRAFDG